MGDIKEKRSCFNNIEVVSHKAFNPLTPLASCIMTQGTTKPNTVDYLRQSKELYHRSGEYWRLTLRDPLILLRGEELRTKLGIGGVISLLGGVGLRDSDCGLMGRSRMKLPDETKGLGLVA